MGSILVSSGKLQLRRQWLAELDQLISQVEAWAVQQRWSVDRSEKTIKESAVGTYKAPALRILTPGGEIRVDPVARDVAGADGRVDLFAWPSLNRIMLVHGEGKWRFVSEDGVPWRRSWNKGSFCKAVEQLQAD